MPGYTEVFAEKGPYAGRRLMLPDDQVAAATAEGGWAVVWEPGAVVIADPNAPIDPAWVLPGWNAYPAIVPPPLPPDTSPPDPEPEPPPEVTPVPITSISNANPAVVEVLLADIGKFNDGDIVTIAGVPSPADHANGPHPIAGKAGITFALTDVDLAAAPSPITTPGMTATPPEPPARTTTVAYTRTRTVTRTK